MSVYRTGPERRKERVTHERCRLQSVVGSSEFGLDVELECPRDTFDAEEIVTVRGHLNLELMRLVCRVIRVCQSLPIQSRLGGQCKLTHCDTDMVLTSSSSSSPYSKRSSSNSLVADQSFA